MAEDNGLRRFANSMNITYVQWRDGDSYDLDVLSQLEGVDLRAAEDMLIARNLADWRDVEALDRIGSERAIAEIKNAIESTNFDVRGEALVRLMIRGLVSDAQIDTAIVTALPTASLINGLIKILRVTSSHRSPAVRKELLRTALDGLADARFHAAAAAHYIHGGSASIADMRFRPLYLRFSSEARPERVAAFRELCSLINLDADALLADFARQPT